jgi:L,D-transpeptidase catalytic domain
VRKKRPDLEDKIAGQVRLDDYGYRFHGTNAPRSIGQNQSHGCVRMRPDDARKVAGLIREYVGQPEHRADDENGSYFILNAPVRLNLVK